MAIQGSFYSTGQRCTASSRIIVTAGIHEAFVACMTERTRSLVVGDARDPKTQIGPVVDANQLAQDEDYVRVGREEGARLACGGVRIKTPKDGFFFSPALFTDCTPGMRIVREEIFGPVVGVIRVKDYEEALVVANDTEFGLSAGICTRSLPPSKPRTRSRSVTPCLRVTSDTART